MREGCSEWVVASATGTDTAIAASPPRPDGRVLKVDATTEASTLFASYRGAANFALLLRPVPVPQP